MEINFSNEKFKMKLNGNFKFDYCFTKFQNSFKKSNAGRLLLIVTRGVYYLKTKQKIYWFTKTRDQPEQTKM